MGAASALQGQMTRTCRVVIVAIVQSDTAQFAAGRAADHYMTLPLATLAPGEYLLKVEAAMGARVAGRAIRFHVKP